LYAGIFEERDFVEEIPGVIKQKNFVSMEELKEILSAFKAEIMKEELIKLLDKAYAPYSNFHVSAIIEMNDGKFIPGVNVENASYGATICAERNALYTAIAEGYKKGDIKEIHIMSKTEDDCFPCFICRHAISDLCDKDVKVCLQTNIFWCSG